MNKYKTTNLAVKILELQNIVDVQCKDGNWNYDNYMHGMANGLILALSILNNEEPRYLEAPKKWLAKHEND